MPETESDRAETDLLKAWALAAQRPARGEELRTSLLGVSSRAASASLTPQGLRGVLIPLRPGERPRIAKELRQGSTGAIRAERSQYRSDSSVVDAMHVWCVDQHCTDAFTSFAAMLIERVDGSGIGEELEACYEEFVRLVGRAEELPITVTGLLGELLVLRDLIARDVRAVNFWGGPRGERHDFRHAVNAIEVKSSRRSDSKSSRIHVSDWDQLEVPPGGRLFLHAIRLEKVSGGPLSISSLAAEIRAKLNVECLTIFDDALSKHDSRVLTSTEEFAELSRHTYEIRADFPRLVPSSVNAEANLKGVSAVQYELDLQQAEDFSVEWTAALDVVFAGD